MSHHFSLPPPSYQGSPWDEGVLTRWGRKAARVENLAKTAGAGRNYDADLRRARTLLVAQKDTELAQGVKRPRFARAVLELWANDAVLASHTLTLKRFAHLFSELNLSRLGLATLAQVYFKYFQEFDTWNPGLFESITSSLSKQLQVTSHRKISRLIEAIRADESIFLAIDGPQQLAYKLVHMGEDFYTWCTKNGLTNILMTNFGQLTLEYFYIAQIDAANAASPSHDFLDAIVKEVTIRSQSAHQKGGSDLFGHKVLTALMSKDLRRPSEPWIKAVTRIAGDPRLDQTTQWRTWWGRLDSHLVERARQWMRGVDLRAFLNGVEKFAQEERNTAMIRMLGPRRALLEGLYEQDRVVDVRLVLGNYVRKFVAQETTLPLHDVATLEGEPRLAVIYVDCGDFALVEGSHNFSLHMYFPGTLPLVSQHEIQRISTRELRLDLPERQKERHGLESYTSLTHQGFWIEKVLNELLIRGIKVNERGLMNRNYYSQLLRNRAARRW